MRVPSIDTLSQTICQITGAQRAERAERLQSLWSGYGEIVRYRLAGADTASVVLKVIDLPEQLAHPHGWHSDTGHRRKLRSYEVEAQWYSHYAARCGSGCPVAHCYAVIGEGVGSALILEDLDAAGYTERLAHASPTALSSSLRWLARFHARFVGDSATGLWHRGSYWHLHTRPDELAAMPDSPLKRHAAALDAALAGARHQTLIHGDAKIANFCYTPDHRQLSAVDFQYVGAGVGVVDLAYFLGSCLDEQQLLRHGDDLLENYMSELQRALLQEGKLSDSQRAALLSEWRELYPIAWADFERFLRGWRPGHPKLHGYSGRQSALALARLERRV